MGRHIADDERWGTMFQRFAAAWRCELFRRAASCQWHAESLADDDDCRLPSPYRISGRLIGTNAARRVHNQYRHQTKCGLISRIAGRWRDASK